MSKKAEIAEGSIFDKLEDLKNAVSLHLTEINTMVVLAREVAIVESEGDKLIEDWSNVFDIIGYLQKMTQEKTNEIDELLAEQRVSEQDAQPITAGLKRMDALA